jgi:D-alanine-D-alanine ligase
MQAMTKAAEALGKVAVIYGGTSAERDVSIMSGTGVLKALREAGADAQGFDPKSDRIEALREGGFDRAFLILHGRGGEDGVIQGVMEYLRLPYTGCGVQASAITMDKEATKVFWRAAGIPVPKGRVVTEDTDFEALVAELGDRIIVKPTREGSSIGLYRVENATAESVREAVRKAAACASSVLAEEMVQGRELTVALLDEGCGLKALPIVEICAPKGDYDYEHKYFSDDTQYFCPAAVDAEVTSRIQAACEAAARAVGAAGWSRIDVILRDDGSFVLLEINTAPGMTPHSLVPLAARTAGISYQELVVRVAAGAALKG